MHAYGWGTVEHHDVGASVGGKFTRAVLHNRFFQGLIVSNTKTRKFFVVVDTKGGGDNYSVYLKNIFLNAQEVVVETVNALELIDDPTWMHENFCVTETPWLPTAIAGKQPTPPREFIFRTKRLGYDVALRIGKIIHADHILRDVVNPSLMWTNAPGGVGEEIRLSEDNSGDSHYWNVSIMRWKTFPFTLFNRKMSLIDFLNKYWMADVK